MQAPRISVFGLGYVGSVTAACLAERGCRVIGCDVSEAKVEKINSGKAPIGEPGLDDLLGAQRLSGAVEATTDARDAVSRSEISIICVGTPSLPSGALDLSYVETVAGEIAEAVQEKNAPHVVIFRSTMLPGSTRGLYETAFSDVHSLVTAFFYPEFLRQGSALEDFRNPSLSAFGHLTDEETSEAWMEFLLEENTERMSVEEAELLKYACNAFHATKVAFANEIGRLAKGLDIDSKKVMAALCEDHRLNISPYYLRPGTPFGGSCLPKDVNALTQSARRQGVAVPVLDSLIVSNRKHLESLLERVEARKNRTILIVGLAFKAGTDDLRGSAMLDLSSELLLRGYTVRIFDPDVSPEKLIGANRHVAESRLPSFDTLLVESVGEALSADIGSTTIVVTKPCLDSSEFVTLLESRNGDHVIDVNYWSELEGLVSSYEGICW